MTFRKSWTRYLFATIASFGYAGSASAAVITVDEDCHLVDAIQAANLDAAFGACPAGDGADEIWLTSDVELSEVFADDPDGTRSGLPGVESEITIDGRGHTILRPPGADILRFLYVSSIGDLRLANVSIVNFSGTDSESFRRGTLRVDMDGDLQVVNSGFFDNAGSTIAHPEPYGSTQIVIRNSTLAGNHGTVISMDGFFYENPKLFVESSTISNNRGGGVRGGDATIVGSTFVGNGSTAVSPEFSHATIIASTLADNGAGVSWGQHAGATIVNSTITGNRLGLNPAADFYTGISEVKNSIIAGNRRDCQQLQKIDFIGGNFQGAASCAELPRVFRLDDSPADHGGPTPTLALLEGSNAIGGGRRCDEWDTVEPVTSIDQRGVARDRDGCDSGAFEFGDAALQLESDGLCPGTVTFKVAGAAGDTATLLLGSRIGTSVVETGCGRTRTGLRNGRSLAIVPIGEGGEGEIEIEMPRADCGRPIQAIDELTCGLSELSVVGRPPAPPTCGIAARCSRRLHLESPAPIVGVGDQYLVGDWDGDGCDNLALRTGNTIAMDINFDLDADLVFDYGSGQTEDDYLVGDWNGDGCDDIAVRRGDQLLMDLDLDGFHDRAATFGPGGGAEYLIGDLDGSGTEAIVFRDGNALRWDLSPWNGVEDGSTSYGGGDAEDQYLLGSWSDDGTSRQTFAVRRDDEILMNYDLDGTHDFVQSFGEGDLEDEYLVGDWDGDGRDNVASRRGGVIRMDTDFDAVAEIEMEFGAGTCE